MTKDDKHTIMFSGILGGGMVVLYIIEPALSGRLLFVGIGLILYSMLGYIATK